MAFELKKLPKSEAEVLITLPFAEFEPYLERALDKIVDETELKGFRKGKAPRDLVARHAGEGAILERAADAAVHGTYAGIFERVATEWKSNNHKDFFPIGHPDVTVTKLARGNDFQYKVKLAVLPDVTLPDYKKIAAHARKEKKDISVTEEEIEKTIQWIRESRSPLVAVSRPVQDNDSVEIDFEIRHGGEPVQEGVSKNHPLVIGKGKFIPGFEDQLVGMKTGEEKAFSLTAPEDWHQKAFAGKELEYKVSMNSVQERILPPLDDAFAKNLGHFDSFAALAANVRDGLTQEKQEKEVQRIRALAIEEIAKEVTIEIPDILVDRELQKTIDELKVNVEQMGLEWASYLNHVKKSEVDLHTDLRPEAERRVRIALTLRAIAEGEHLEPSDKEVEERAQEVLKQYTSAGDAAKGIDSGQLREYARGILKNEKVFEFLEKIEK